VQGVEKGEGENRSLYNVSAKKKLKNTKVLFFWGRGVRSDFSLFVEGRSWSLTPNPH